MGWVGGYRPCCVGAGLGGCRVGPVAGEDVAGMATWAAGQAENVVVDAAGPEIISYAELVHSVATALRRRARIVSMPAGVTLAMGGVVGLLVRDVVLTRQELQGLMQELLVSREEQRCARRVDDWLLRSAGSLGRSYASELSRHFR